MHRFRHGIPESDPCDEIAPWAVEKKKKTFTIPSPLVTFLIIKNE